MALHHISLLLKTLFFSILLCSSLSQALNFTHSTFQDYVDDDLFLKNYSYVVNQAIQVTPDYTGASIANKAGRAMYNESFKLWSNKEGIVASFNTTFVLNISPRTNPVGEGLAFLFAEDPYLPENSYGQWLGIVNSSTNGSTLAPRTVAVEFDTRKSYEDDLDDNHAGLDVNSAYSIKQVSMSDFGLIISSGNDTKVIVTYDGKMKNMTVFVSVVGENGVWGARNLVFSESIDLSKHLPENVYIGFSASTSNFTQLNCVKSWEFHGDEIEDEPMDDSQKIRKKPKDLVWLYIAAPMSAILLVSIVAFFLWKLRSKESVDLYANVEEEIRGASMAPRKFRLKELKNATGNFNPENKLGKGGFGTVYKGTLNNKVVAVKRISKKSLQGKDEFVAEVKTIGNLNHKNLVKLLGWCYESSEFLLVYEFMPNSSLDKYIFHNDTSLPKILTLSWENRLSIINGVAQALDYLHNGCEKRVLHRDIKAGNIMLDSNFVAKLGDFGLARAIQKNDETHHSTKEIAGTPGYMAPESILTGRATVETDVYSFGILLLEVVCGRKPGHQNPENDYSRGISHWLWGLYGSGRILDAADTKLEEEYQPEEVETVLVLGLACCHPNPYHRPSMKYVLQVLNGEAPPPFVPANRPSFVWPAFPETSMSSTFSLSTTLFSDIGGR